MTLCGTYPTSMLVDSSGNIVGEVISGVRTKEQYDGAGKLEYLEVYNKAEDTKYNYEAGKDLLRKTTKCTQKGQAANLYENGFFTLANNALTGDFKTIEYNGKKAVYSLNTNEGTDKNGKKFKSEWEYWYDAETGILLKDAEKSFEQGKLIRTISSEYTVKPNQKFDEAVFKYDPNNTEAANLKK